jgi:hypothetical protein
LRNPTGDERKRHPVEELIYESSILLDAKDFKGFFEEPVSRPLHKSGQFICYKTGHFYLLPTHKKIVIEGQSQ